MQEQDLVTALAAAVCAANPARTRRTVEADEWARLCAEASGDALTPEDVVESGLWLALCAAVRAQSGLVLEWAREPPPLRRLLIDMYPPLPDYDVV